jgi:UDP-N-acetylmuramoyl-L-alanyl-D-glutamate--2,6-diaminopimelate ligase
MRFDIKLGDTTHSLKTSMVGDYNVSNLTGVIACLCALGHRLEDAVDACLHLPSVPGRMELFGNAGDPLVVVDFAHTPDAIEKALLALKPLRHMCAVETLFVYWVVAAIATRQSVP